MKVAFLTAGGLAPCLSASIGALIRRYNELVPDADMMGYLNGYLGLLLGKSVVIPPEVKRHTDVLMQYGGSPIGNSRVKLTNEQDCVKRGYVHEGEDPLQVAAQRLVKDGVTILHAIGGDDTNIMAGELTKCLSECRYDLTVVGLPKTVDNDVFPISQTLGAWTAAEQGAIFFENIANENTTSTRQLIIHEVMGRHSGWLTAATAREYRKRLRHKSFLPEILLTKDRWDIDAVYVPEMRLDIASEAGRLKERMDRKDGVNIFLSEGAGVESIIEEMDAKGEKIPRDAFGHVKLDEINPGVWFGKQFGVLLGAQKVLVQKSGYFARSAPPNEKDLDLIIKSANVAAECALAGKSGVVGLDQDKKDELSLIDFSKIKGGKPFDTAAPWFLELLTEIGQPMLN